MLPSVLSKSECCSARIVAVINALIVRAVDFVHVVPDSTTMLSIRSEHPPPGR